MAELLNMEAVICERDRFCGNSRRPIRLDCEALHVNPSRPI